VLVLEYYIYVLVIGVIAGIVSGIIGTGSSIMLLPVLILTYGPKQAVPIMAIAAILANVSRVWAWWRELDWRAFMAYSITGVPAAALGASTLWVLPSSWVNIGLGLFFLAIIPIRHLLASKSINLALWQLSLAGAVIGFLTGVVLSTGPLSVPAFAGYGLVKGAFLATEAASSLAIYISKVATFGGLGALSFTIIIQGIIVGSSLMLGTWASKLVVRKMNVAVFRYMLDILLLVSGVSMIWASFN